MDFWYYSCDKAEVQNRCEKFGGQRKSRREGGRSGRWGLQLPPWHLWFCLYTQIHSCPVRSNLCSCRLIFEVAGKDCKNQAGGWAGPTELMCITHTCVCMCVKCMWWGKGVPMKRDGCQLEASCSQSFIPMFLVFRAVYKIRSCITEGKEQERYSLEGWKVFLISVASGQNIVVTIQFRQLQKRYFFRIYTVT